MTGASWSSSEGQVDERGALLLVWTPPDEGGAQVDELLGDKLSELRRDGAPLSTNVSWEPETPRPPTTVT